MNLNLLSPILDLLVKSKDIRFWNSNNYSSIEEILSQPTQVNRFRITSREVLINNLIQYHFSLFSYVCARLFNAGKNSSSNS